MPDQIPYAEMIAALTYLIQSKGLSVWIEPSGANKLRTVLAHLERTQWRPIESYPRDHDAGADTYWGPNALLFVPTGHVAPASDYRILTGRLEADMWLAWDNGGSMWDITGQPSHWMPLPPSPETPR